MNERQEYSITCVLLVLTIGPQILHSTVIQCLGVNTDQEIMYSEVERTDTKIPGYGRDKSSVRILYTGEWWKILTAIGLLQIAGWPGEHLRSEHST